MVIVALETVTRAGSVAVWDGGQVHAWSGDPADKHGARLPDDVVRVLAESGRALRDVDLFAVVSGPGSFTGLRVGVAAVQGLCQALGRPALGIPTLDALAEAWRLTSPEPARIVACLDGLRGEVFYQVFDVDTLSASLDGATRVTPASVAKPEGLVDVLRDLGPGKGTVLVGDGARRYEQTFTHAGLDLRIVDAPRTLAEAAVRLAAEHPEGGSAPHALQPIYVRKTDAEEARDRRLAARGATELVIRPMAPNEDLSAVERLQRETLASPWGADAIKWELEHNQVARLWVAERPGGALVGYCACWVIFDELHINSIAVDPSCRRRGVARRLLGHVISEGVARGVRSATLEVRESNTAAKALYEHLGFRVEAVRKDYYREPREHALILWHRRLAEAEILAATGSKMW